MEYERSQLLCLQWRYFGIDYIRNNEIYTKKRNGILFELHISSIGEIGIYKDKELIYFSFCSNVLTLEFISNSLILQESEKSCKFGIHVTDTRKQPKQGINSKQNEYGTI